MTKRLMGSASVVEVEVAVDSGPRLDKVRVSSQVDLLVLQRTPEPFDEDVVDTAALAIHADLHSRRQQDGRERRRRELRALVRVEDSWPAKAAQRLLQRLHAQPGVQRVRQPPRQHAS